MLETGISYRSDIDGLRAISVLGVILYHFDSKLIPGGFYGVDVFFVISGYLITTLISAQINSNKFRISEFYYRRARRILPTLILVCVATWILGWLFLLPSELTALGKNLLASATFSNNFVLWFGTNYFDNSSWRNPLLHLWSLSVEEQFYLLWPGIILLATILNVRLMATLVLLISSFAAYIFYLGFDPQGAFYIFYTRAWEILLGGVIAGVSLCHRSERTKLWLSGLGFTMILLSFTVLSAEAKLPGLRSLVPTIGAALLIVTGPTSWVATRILSRSSMVSIGLISYPLYLWHWPLFSYLRIAGLSSASFLLAGAFAAFFLSWVTFRWVEQPIRKGRTSVRQNIILISIGWIFIAAIGWASWKGYISPRLNGTDADLVVKASQDWTPAGFAIVNNQFLPLEFTGMSRDAILFLGDSHIEQYFPRLQRLYNTEMKFTSYFLSFSGCPPIPNGRSGSPDQLVCGEMLRVGLEIVRNIRIKKVVMGARWHYYLSDPDTRAERLRAFEDMLVRMKNSGKECIIVLSNPEGEGFSPLNLVSRWNGKFLNSRTLVPLNVAQKATSEADQQLREIAERLGIQVIDPSNFLCDQNGCINQAAGYPAYTDFQHLNSTFVRDHISYLDRIFQ